MRHVLTNVVGARDQVEVHVRELSLLPGDRLLLCSDGLHEPMTDDLIAPVLGGEADVTPRPRALVRAALERGTRDNVTALVVRCRSDSNDDGTGGSWPGGAAASGRTARAHRPLQASPIASAAAPWASSTARATSGPGGRSRSR